VSVTGIVVRNDRRVLGHPAASLVPAEQAPEVEAIHAPLPSAAACQLQ
jgi:hypothetical protein